MLDPEFGRALVFLFPAEDHRQAGQEEDDKYQVGDPERQCVHRYSPLITLPEGSIGHSRPGRQEI